MKRFIVAIVLLVVAAAVLTAGAAARGQSGAVVKLGQSNLGRIIVDSHGRTLYLFAHDKHGKSTCYGACASYWPPLITRGKPHANSGARSRLVGTTRRKDGKLQVTYHGHPLYRFSGDTGAGQTTGEGLTDFGGRWYAVSAAGSAVVKSAASSHRVHARLSGPGLLTVVGTDASDKIALRLQSGQPGILQVDVGDDGSADFSFARNRVATIAVDAAAGDDLVRIDESNGAFTDSIPTTIDGGDGNDTIAGGKGIETLLGGDGNDSIDGNGGNDLALLGAGDDTFVWDPGDGSDTIEGQDGTDTMRFNGANVARARRPVRKRKSPHVPPRHRHAPAGHLKEVRQHRDVIGPAVCQLCEEVLGAFDAAPAPQERYISQPDGCIEAGLLNCIHILSFC